MATYLMCSDLKVAAARQSLAVCRRAVSRLELTPSVP